MDFLVIIIALAIVLSFGYWSRKGRRKLQKSQDQKVYPLSRSRRYLRRVK